MKHLFIRILLFAVATGGITFAEGTSLLLEVFLLLWGELGSINWKRVTRRTEETRLFNRF